MEARTLAVGSDHGAHSVLERWTERCAAEDSRNNLSEKPRISIEAGEHSDGAGRGLTLRLIAGYLSILRIMAGALTGHVRTTKQNGIIGVSLDMLFQVLGTFEGLAAKVAAMRLQRHMNTNVRGDVVTFNDRDVAVGPSAFQVEVVGAFATDVNLAHVILSSKSSQHEEKDRESRLRDRKAYVEGFGTLGSFATTLP